MADTPWIPFYFSMGLLKKIGVILYSSEKFPVIAVCYSKETWSQCLCDNVPNINYQLTYSKLTSQMNVSGHGEHED